MVTIYFPDPVTPWFLLIFGGLCALVGWLIGWDKDKYDRGVMDCLACIEEPGNLIYKRFKRIAKILRGRKLP